MPAPLHIIEPTLCDLNGHCYALALSLCQAHAGRPAPLELWVNRAGAALFAPQPGVTVHGFFRRRWRRLQTLWLLRRLLRTPGRVLIQTARTTDFLLLRLAAGAPIRVPGQVYLYVHWYTRHPRKLRFLRAFVARHPGVTVLAPTEGVCAIFRESGFPHVALVPYPMADLIRPPDPQHPAPYAGLLYPGAARLNKGYPLVVDIAAALAAAGAMDPVTIHSLPPPTGEFEPPVAAAVAKLRGLHHAPLTELSEPLAPGAFQALFPGRIVLQPFDRAGYRDRVSTVTMEAMRGGSPVIVPSDTWMAELVTRYDAGMVVTDLSAAAFLAAIQRIKADYSRYQANAFRAGAAVQRQHDPRRLIAAVYGEAAE